MDYTTVDHQAKIFANHPLPKVLMDQGKSVNANWLLTGQGEMFNTASGAVDMGMQEVWALYQRLGEKERALLLEVARAFAGVPPQ